MTSVHQCSLVETGDTESGKNSSLFPPDPWFDLSGVKNGRTSSKDNEHKVGITEPTYCDDFRDGLNRTDNCNSCGPNDIHFISKDETRRLRSSERSNESATKICKDKIMSSVNMSTHRYQIEHTKDGCLQDSHKLQPLEVHTPTRSSKASPKQLINESGAICNEYFANEAIADHEEKEDHGSRWEMNTNFNALSNEDPLIPPLVNQTRQTFSGHNESYLEGRASQFETERYRFSQGQNERCSGSQVAPQKSEDCARPMDSILSLDSGQIICPGGKKCYPWRGCRRRSLNRMLSLAAVYTIVLTTIFLYRGYMGEPYWSDGRSRSIEDKDSLGVEKLLYHSADKSVKSSNGLQPLSRFKRSTPPKNKNSTNGTGCETELQGGHFPNDFLDKDVTNSGGWIVHLLVAIYTFGAIAGVCDDYFVPALEHICEDLGLPADVAGATFMAAASSAPEFCTSVIGVFLAKSDVGLGAIVGSSIFNLLFIIGACAIFAGMPIQLSWYPLSRDSIFYTISVIEMAIFISDSFVSWEEALVMILTYVLYVITMAFNSQLQSKANALVRKIKKDDLDKLRRSSSHRLKMMEQRRRSRIAFSTTEADRNSLESAVRELSRIGIPHELAKDLIHENVILQESAKKRKKTMDDNEKSGGKELTDVTDSPPVHHDGVVVHVSNSPLEEPESPVDGTKIAKLTDNVEFAAESRASSDKEDEEGIPNPFEFPQGTLSRLYWIVMMPITILHHFTIPDSRQPGWQARLYLLSFFLCIAYIVLYSYVMVWMVEVISNVLNIPTTVTGLTILAAGTSVPDCLSSVFVARDGYGDMAVSNAIGSNVFDILLCLGIPWFIDGVILGKNGTTIDSEGMIYAVLSLCITIFYLILSLKYVDWTLTRTYGVIMLLVYVFIITICILIELNVFFELHQSKC